jgi:hypothetical protein
VRVAALAERATRLDDCGCAKSASSPRLVIKPQCIPLITILGGAVGPAMFARWSQENFFRYMRQSYNLDGLVLTMVPTLFLTPPWW